MGDDAARGPRLRRGSSRTGPGRRAELALRVRASVRSRLRHVLRVRGYDVVKTSVGYGPAQRLTLARCDAVIDVGANSGQFAEWIRDLGVRLPIVSFEPGAAAYEMLRRKAARQGDWTVRKVALDARPGRRTLRVSANSVSSSLLDVTPQHVHGDAASAAVSSEEVEVSTLDAELADVPGDALYLKVDVQGLELAVLGGAERTLARTVAVQVEVSFVELYAGEDRWLDVCGFLEQHGFVVRSIKPEFEDRRIGAVLQCDLLWCRPELLDVGTP